MTNTERSTCNCTRMKIRYTLTKLPELIPQHSYWNAIGRKPWKMIGTCRHKISSSCVLTTLTLQYYRAQGLSPSDIPIKDLFSHLNHLNDLNNTQHHSNSRLNFEFGLTLQLLSEKMEKDPLFLQHSDISEHLTPGFISSLDSRHLIQKAQESYLQHLGEVRVELKSRPYCFWTILTSKP